MADRFELHAENLPEVMATFKVIPEAIRKKGIQFGLRKGANLVRDAAKANAKRLDDPATAEDIAANIAVRTSSSYYRRTGDVMFRVGVRGGAATYANDRWNRAKRRAGKTYRTDGSKGNPGGDTWYWRFLEFGTRISPAKPFLRPALENNIQPAIDETAKHTSRWLDRNIPKLRAQGKL